MKVVGLESLPERWEKGERLIVLVRRKGRYSPVRMRATLVRRKTSKREPAWAWVMRIGNEALLIPSSTLVQAIAVLDPEHKDVQVRAMMGHML